MKHMKQRIQEVHDRYNKVCAYGIKDALNEAGEIVALDTPMLLEFLEQSVAYIHQLEKALSDVQVARFRYHLSDELQDLLKDS